MKIFIYTSLNESNQAVLRQRIGNDHTLTFRSAATPAPPADVAVLMGNPPTEQVRALSNLRFWQLDSAGFDKYAGIKLAIPVCNMGDFFAWPCAETIVGAVLALYRRLDELAVQQRAKNWIGVPLRYTMHTLHRQRVVILGAGTIGQAVRSILSGFQCQISLLARTNPAANLHSPDDLLAALPTTDLLINTLPGSVDGFVSAEVIAAMKPGSFFANVGRGNTVDEAALIAALQNGHLGGAALDVTAQEPLPADNSLWAMPNVLLTQHTAGGQRGEDEGKVAQFIHSFGQFIRGETPDNQVDLERGY
ncbi:D-2-hydroxyacid dehydrogenase [Fibrella aquatilis]|uniref:D-2-hydroxyacid dehydrogenase n=1 Tax=Fibrella aquatilis TaxID=2817059 RepID=A0A939JXJ7_9BACT|nr:D-2-hydroxyacid dehydrogenase [Fibrella aquatilis]MBO0931104.1 D-2-hydroxyacid dehydrogenase [Fibrella aquatilis]